MAPAPTPPLPGSMTVPPLFGWEILLTVLLVLAGLAVVFFLVSAAGRGADDRPDWEAWLDARSHRRPDDDGARAAAHPLPARRRTEPTT